MQVQASNSNWREPWDKEMDKTFDEQLGPDTRPKVAAKIERIKKPKVMKQVKRRKLSAKKAKKYFASPIQSVKLIWEHEYHGQAQFVIQFPNDEAEKYKEELEKIESASLLTTTYVDPTGNDSKNPEDVVFVQRWKIHRSDEMLQVVAAFGKKHKFDFDGDILVRAAMAGQEGKRLFRMSSAKSNSEVVIPIMGKNKFKAFQRAGIAYALEAKRCFIADEMGLGKTVEAIGVAAVVKQFPILIITPNTLKINWERECTKWFGKKRTSIVLRNRDLPTLNNRVPKGEDPASVPQLMSDKKKARVIKSHVAWLKAHDIIIVNYDKLKKWIEYFKALAPQFVVFDESHYVKGNSARSRVCKELMDDITPEYILMLTGTPIMSRPIELIRQLQIMGRMAEFGGVQHFMNRYCSIVNVDMSQLPPLPKMNEDGSMPDLTEEEQLGYDMRNELIRKAHENQIELNTRLRSVCYVRREKCDVLTELPDKVRSTLTFEISNRAEYESIEEDVIGYLGDRAAKDEKFLKSIKKLSQEEKIRRIKAQRNTAEEKSSRAQVLVKIEMLKQAAAIGKLGSVKEWIEDFFEQNPKEKLLVFATHKRIIDELEAMFPKICITIRGTDSEKARLAAEDAFQDKKNMKAKLLVGSLKAAGVGLTLTAASNVAFVELGWTPAIHDQAEDRLHRITQKNNVTAYYLLAENTIEERIAQLIEGKRQIVDSVSFGDPLSKSAQTGSILGDLVAGLVGKTTLL